MDMKPLKEMDSVLLSLALVSEVQSEFGLSAVEPVRAALTTAATLHINDFRKSERAQLERPPYIEHPLRVALRPLRYFPHVSLPVVIAAVLHDTVEDHARDFFGNTLPEHESRSRLLAEYGDKFGSAVERVVRKVTNPIFPATATAAAKREMYAHHVRESIIDDADAFMVKFSDFVDNAGSLHLTNDAGDPQTIHLLSKYAPLFPVFEEGISVLFSGVQQEEMRDRLHKIQSEFAEMSGK